MKSPFKKKPSLITEEEIAAAVAAEVKVILESEWSEEELAELKYWWGSHKMPTTVSC